MDLLWSKRFNAFINDRIFLLRRLANGFAFLPLLIFLLGLYYYPQLIAWLPANFSVKLAFSIIIGWAVTRGNFRSFLLMTDIVYLLSKEKSMNTYFRRCYYFNVILQGFFILATLVLLSPLYFARVSSSMNDFIVFIIILLILKAWNVFIFWQSLKIGSNSFKLIRFAINFTFIYGLLLKALPMVSSGVILMSIFYWGLLKFKQTNRLDWLRLIELEQRLDARYYAWISSFVEHPHMKSKVKHHKFLAKVVDGLSKKPAYAYHYLYLKMFIRTDILGIVFRIMIIGMLMLWLIPNTYFILATYIALLLIIGLQLHSFRYTFINQFWASLYPLTEENRKQAYLWTSFNVLLVAAFILLIPVFIKNFTFSVIATYFLIAFAISYSFIFLYLRKKYR